MCAWVSQERRGNPRFGARGLKSGPAHSGASVLDGLDGASGLDVLFVFFMVFRVGGIAATAAAGRFIIWAIVVTPVPSCMVRAKSALIQYVHEAAHADSREPGANGRYRHDQVKESDD